jgi:hypothetical protein
MTLAQRTRNWTLAAALMLGMAAPALAQVASTTDDSNPATRDALRTGGCTGCFDTQMQAAISTFSSIKRVFRVCQTGGGVTVNHNCDGNGHGARADFVELQGDLRNSTTDAAGLGVPGGATNVTIRVAANGSGNGLTCASATSPGPIGFIAPEGFDGIPNTADDAGGTGVFGAVGPGKNDPADGGSGTGTAPALGNQHDTAPALAACNTNVFQTYNFSPPGTTATAFPALGTQEFCVVNVDQGTDGAIKNDRAGAATPGQITRLGQLDPTNETTNLKLTCDLGFADLPPTDFIQASLNTLTFQDQDVYGAQIFKLIASKDVHANGDVHKKVQLADPQIEGMWNAWAANTVCSWQQVGAQSGASRAGTGSDINVCYRTLGSGTREVFRNTFDANTKGDAQQGTGSIGGNGLTNGCGQKVGAPTVPPGTNQAFFKSLIEGGGTNDVKLCVQSHVGAVGYVDGFVHPDTTEFYSVPVEGVDADSNDLKLLTRCGLYRYWGPLAGGSGPRLGAGVLTAFETAHKSAMKNPSIYLANEAYLPFAGLNFAKTATDGAYFTQFVSTPNGAADACPGTINPPIAIPGVP